MKFLQWNKDGNIGGDKAIVPEFEVETHEILNARLGFMSTGSEKSTQKLEHFHKVNFLNDAYLIVAGNIALVDALKGVDFSSHKTIEKRFNQAMDTVESGLGAIALAEEQHPQQ